MKLTINNINNTNVAVVKIVYFPLKSSSFTEKPVGRHFKAKLVTLTY